MFGKHTDKYLIGIVVGSIVLVITSMFMVQSMPEPSYKDGVSPESVAHNYLLALHQDDYVRAYSYLSMQFYSGGIFSDGYDLSTFRMTLRLDNEVWKIRSASQYWSNCLSDPSACQ